MCLSESALWSDAEWEQRDPVGNRVRLQMRALFTPVVVDPVEVERDMAQLLAADDAEWDAIDREYGNKVR